MMFNIEKRKRITGGEEYVIKSINDNVIVSISLPAYKVKNFDDLKKEIMNFWDIAKEEIILNFMEE